MVGLPRKQVCPAVGQNHRVDHHRLAQLLPTRPGARSSEDRRRLLGCQEWIRSQGDDPDVGPEQDQGLSSNNENKI